MEQLKGIVATAEELYSQLSDNQRLLVTFAAVTIPTLAALIKMFRRRGGVTTKWNKEYDFIIGKWHFDSTRQQNFGG